MDSRRVQVNQAKLLLGKRKITPLEQIVYIYDAVFNVSIAQNCIRTFFCAMTLPHSAFYNWNI